SHNPPAPELLDITDRLGVLILDEAFDTWEQTKTTSDYGKYFTAWAQRDIQGMVKRDRNHPSIILWSIGNEVGGSTTATATNMINWVKALDTTREITWASNKMGGPKGNEVGVARGVQQKGRPARERGRQPQRHQAAGRGRLQLRALRRRLRRGPLR